MAGPNPNLPVMVILNLPDLAKLVNDPIAQDAN